MPDVNDDMNELFKRAAENYPLNTQGADWSKVQKALQPLQSPLNNNNDNKKYRKLLWLLLLIPCGFVLNKFVFNHATQNQPQQIVIGKSNDLPENRKTEQQAPGNQKAVDKRNAKSITSTTEANSSLLKNISKNTNEDFVLSTSKKKLASATGEFPDKRSVSDLSASAEDKNITNQKDNSVKSKDVKNDTEVSQPQPIRQSIVAGSNADVSVENNSVKGNDKTQVTDTLKHSIVKDPKQKAKHQHFYAGVIIGPDVSTVKLQRINRTGFTAGLLAGYNFNKIWSIESGLYLDEKYYYSGGKYFNTNKVYIPSYTKIEDIDGVCHMIEIPVNVKYNFKTTKASNWFALAGVSSYLMKKENYGYRYMSYGTLMEKQLSYNNSSKNWASILNLSVGYTHNIKKLGMVRIEPYIKIPFKGVGIGSLPITSSGVYLGFTKNLF